jgi:3-oxo-4-pregnene-20-carboxyl-CoA dehydrogenase alpha subunit
VDFTLADTQQAVIEAAVGVLGQRQPRAQAQALASAPAPGPGAEHDYDRALWKELGQAGLLGLAVPERLGGGGLGVLEVAALLTEIGKRAAPVPALATLMMGVLPLTRWAGQALQSHYLPGVGAGDVVLTAAVREPSEPMPVHPVTTASDRDGSVTGVKIGVPYAAAADRILVPATLSEGGTAIVLVHPADGGVTIERTPTSTGAPEYTLRLDEATIVSIIGGTDERKRSGAVADLYQLTLAGACSLADGALAAALALTTDHVAARQQFGRPLATFQAVAQHVADVAIASRTLHLAALSGCWRLDSGRDAGPDLDVAAYWLADQAPEAMRTCHHLHGGTGMDVQYPLHRYSALVKDLVRLVGGADYRLGLVGARACATEAADVP